MPKAKQTFSPAEFAAAVGVSESSVKRWIDNGKIAATKTPGGHRRISLVETLRYLREAGQQPASPGFLGLPGVERPEEGIAPKPTREVQLAYQKALSDGNEPEMRSLATLLYAQGHRIEEICDTMVSKTFCEFVQQIDPESGEAYRIYRAQTQTQNVLLGMGDLADTVSQEAPLVLLASTEPALDSLGLAIAAAVLKHAGFRTESLGVSVPPRAISAAMHHLQPHAAVVIGNDPSSPNWAAELSKLLPSTVNYLWLSDPEHASPGAPHCASRLVSLARQLKTSI